MKAIKILKVFMVLFVGILISCSGDDEDPGVTQHLPKTRLIRVTNSINDYETNYTYDAQARMIRQTNIGASGESHFDFTYRADGKLDKVIGGGVTKVFSYNPQGKTSDIKFYYGTDETVTPQTHYQLTYPESNVMVVRIFYGSDPDAIRTVYNYDAKGNLESLEVYRDSNESNPDGDYESTSYCLENDQMNNPCKDFDKGYYYDAVQPNNPVVQQVAGNPTLTHFTYEYNADNYPISRTSDGGSVVYYEYKKI